MLVLVKLSNCQKWSLWLLPPKARGDGFLAPRKGQNTCRQCLYAAFCVVMCCQFQSSIWGFRCIEVSCRVS